MAFQVPAGSSNLGMNLSHAAAKLGTKLYEDLMLPLVVFSIHLGLDLLVINPDISEAAADFRSIECSPTLSDFLKKLKPLRQIISQDFVNLLRPKIPK